MQVIVGNDSGLKHLAAVAGVPVVEISGLRSNADPGHPNSPQRFHAWGVPYRVYTSKGEGFLAIEEVLEDSVRRACADLLVLTLPRRVL